MGEFTGDYYRCNKCSHIWDFTDICPNCGHENSEDLNAKEVREIAADHFYEQNRLKEMLRLHGD